MNENRYYGVAWNYSEDTYRVTGMLTDVKNYEDAEERMFIHNSIKKLSDGSYKIPKTYYRRQQTETEVVIDISDAPLPGFELCPVATVVSFLETIDYDIYRSFKGPTQWLRCTNCDKIFEFDKDISTEDVECPECGSNGLELAQVFCLKPIWVKEWLCSDVPKEGYVLHPAFRQGRTPIFGCYEPTEKEGKEE